MKVTVILVVIGAFGTATKEIGELDWLVSWVLWHINPCRLFNTKSIFMQIVLLQTIQFSMSTQFNC